MATAAKHAPFAYADAVRLLEKQGYIEGELQDSQFATWEPPFDATALLFRPELLHLPLG